MNHCTPNNRPDDSHSSHKNLRSMKFPAFFIKAHFFHNKKSPDTAATGNRIKRRLGAIVCNVLLGEASIRLSTNKTMTNTNVKTTQNPHFIHFATLFSNTVSIYTPLRALAHMPINIWMFTSELPDMPPSAAQTIYELVQGRKNAVLAFFPE